MNREYISDAVGGIADRHVSAGYTRQRRGRQWLWRPLAAVLAIAVLVGGMWFLLTPKGVTVSAYAAGTDTELTGAGESFTTGEISDSGELTGHPLMFYLTGENIDTVRFSDKNEFINFVDLTEQRDEFGFARNITVPYGERESEYSFLVIDWMPKHIISRLRDGDYGSIRDIPEELRRDIIVMEITFQNGAKTVKAVTVELRDDGSFFAVFDDYEIGEADDFVNRPDAVTRSREDIYSDASVEVTVLDKNGQVLESEAGWYFIDRVGSVRVSWEGREPWKVQAFATPTGTEMAEYTELLATKVVNTAENAVVFPVETFEDITMAHVEFLVTFDSEHILSSGEINMTEEY